MYYLNDNTCEGMADYSRNVFTDQYHPEASPGPQDSGYLFKKYIEYASRCRSSYIMTLFEMVMLTNILEVDYT